MSKVTQRHRELAMIAMRGGPLDEPLYDYTKRFIETGEDPSRDKDGKPNPIYPITARLAQAMADLEEETHQRYTSSGDD